MNSHLYYGITQVFRDTLQINKFSCGYLAINFNRFSIFFFSFFVFKTIHQFNGKSNIWINLILLFIIVAFSSSHTYSCYNIQYLCLHNITYLRHGFGILERDSSRHNFSVCWQWTVWWWIFIYTSRGSRGSRWTSRTLNMKDDNILK